MADSTKPGIVIGETGSDQMRTHFVIACGRDSVKIPQLLCNPSPEGGGEDKICSWEEISRHDTPLSVITRLPSGGGSFCGPSDALLASERASSNCNWQKRGSL